MVFLVHCAQHFEHGCLLLLVKELLLVWERTYSATLSIRLDPLVLKLVKLELSLWDKNTQNCKRTYRNLHNVYPFLNHCTVGLLGFISMSSCWKHIQTVNNFFSVRAVLGTMEVNNYQVTIIILLVLLWNSKYHLVRLMLHGSIGNSILWCYSNGGTTKQAIWRHTDHKECSHYQSFWGTPKSNNCIYRHWLHVLILMEINM